MKQAVVTARLPDISPTSKLTSTAISPVIGHKHFSSPSKQPKSAELTLKTLHNLDVSGARAQLTAHPAVGKIASAGSSGTA